MTVPDGGPVMDVFDVTVAVKVMFWFVNAGLADDESAVVVSDLLIVCEMVFDVLMLNFESPL